MAVEADRVVVELVAQTQGFDTQIKRSGDAFTSTMSDVTKASKGVEAAANDVYTAHNKMGIATNNARIAQMELQHVVRGSVDSYASGGSAATIFAQHIASVAEAASFMGGSLGAVGEVLAGPWGIAITAGVAILATMIARHKDTAESVDTLTEKLKKNHEHTLLQNAADERWSNTLDGLLERLKKLNEETGKRLELPTIVNQQGFANAQAIVDSLNRQIDKAEADPRTSPARLEKLYAAFAAAVKNAYQQTIIAGEQEGAALADLNKRSDDWAASQTDIIRRLLGYHPELQAFAGQINAAFGEMKKAVGDAAKGNVAFDAVTSQVDDLNSKLAESPGFINDYIANLRGLAAGLESTVNAAKDAPKAIAEFQKAVIGAEGTGPNKRGSSAAGFGQFMPDTWMKYFKEAYPDQAATLTRESALDLRNRKDVAAGVIDVATKDYVSILQRAGQQITTAALYTMHLLSAGDPKGTVALRLLTAPSDQDMRAVLGKNYGADVSGNPFLGGTAGSARAAIAKRIGDSSGAVSSGSAAITQEQLALEQKLSDKVYELLGKESEVALVKEHQLSLTDDITHSNLTLSELIKSEILPSLKDWDKQYQQIIDSMAEANRFGAQLVDDILNPDNWQHWGDAGKKILHEVLQEMLLLGAANPLKNLLFGSKLPTLGSIFGQLFGGGGGSIDSAGLIAGNMAALGGPPPPGYATGGILDIGGNGGTDRNLLSINGRPRARVSANEKLAIIPSNAVAAVPGGGMSAAAVRVVIEASPYFDGRVMEVSGPVIAQASVAAANGGATIGRRNLGRESLHRLE